MSKKIIHIHVGKCAGGSINQALNSLNLAFVELHCGDAPEQLKKLIREDQGDNLYLVTARDPIKRFISAFNWDKYEKIIVQKASNPYWNKIYATFESVNDLCESLESKNSEKRELAHFAIKESKLHIELGLAWYCPLETLERIPKERLFLIKTENILEDFNNFLSINFDDKPLFTELAKDKDSSNFRVNIENPKYLSPNSTEILQSALKKDFISFEYLKKLR
ncbi:sulfotransferase family 2 domain-containing protein [Alteromonas mediterranea]|uniref:sulfotransferase family 2 domain-containing protein n=1 Tax=Alteromonas mediterranea TaxID=314275 RepID=UPI00035574FB|nr:hypothetical protein I634_16955 [Alteromonas mediterranea U8]